MADVKFSQFTDGQEMQVGDEVVGLRGGSNYRFDFPGDGIKDSNGDYIFQYLTVPGSPVNFMTFSNNITANGPTIGALGSDANVDINITPKGTGNVVLDGLKWPNSDGTADQVLTTDGSGNLSWETESATGDVLAQVFQLMGA